MRRPLALLLAVPLACASPSPTPSPTPTPTPTPSTSTTPSSTASPTPSTSTTPSTTPSATPSTTPSATPTPPAGALIALRAASPPLLDGQLDDEAWRAAAPIRIETDWRGQPTTLATTAWLAWHEEGLFFAFDCAFDELVVDEAAPVEREHAELYRYDAVELFVDADPSTPATYLELEVGPRGHFLDIAVDRSRRPAGDVGWSSGLRVATRIEPAATGPGGRFTVEANVPASAFGRERLSPDTFRIGLYRLAGRGAARAYLARFPTGTRRPSFHVPERFGTLLLRE